jgi:hypothetical protein
MSKITVKREAPEQSIGDMIRERKRQAAENQKIEKAQAEERRHKSIDTIVKGGGEMAGRFLVVYRDDFTQQLVKYADKYPDAQYLIIEFGYLVDDDNNCIVLNWVRTREVGKKIEVTGDEFRVKFGIEADIRFGREFEKAFARGLTKQADLGTVDCVSPHREGKTGHNTRVYSVETRIKM